MAVGLFLFKGQKSTTPAVNTKSSTTSSAMQKVDIGFYNHIQAKLPEQDVFVVSDKDATKVIRVEGDSAKDPAILVKEAFATATMTPHDPFKVGKNPLGPFEKGADLGFTLKDWLAATGKGTYAVDGDNATLSVSFTGLVPNSSYTVWCSRITFPPKPAVVDRPCGAADGSENVFKSDEKGNSSLTVKMKPLEESTKETASAIALAYHSDGKTYGANPGDFGLNSHVQLFFLMPVPGAK